MVIRNARKLKGTRIYINEDLCPASQELVKVQLPELHKAKDEGSVIQPAGAPEDRNEAVRNEPEAQSGNEAQRGSPTRVDHRPEEADTASVGSSRNCSYANRAKRNVFDNTHTSAKGKKKLDDTINPLYTIPKYTMHCRHRNRHGGGVAMYVSETYTSSLLQDIRDPTSANTACANNPFLLIGLL
ncbi:hypothetical protein E2C01_028130 [Portunus trituberculatus]|uniref:Uncharacterized protein n=1 Tax=Portunus trituberculatus TaxID=210409 RepID=A0A5B7ENI2_PORTR|nr:hypothetical protein [Portunus trituberculatus]